MSKIKVTQQKSSIKCDIRQKKILRALGLKKRSQTVVHEATPQILGMTEKVSHLVNIEDVE